MLIIGCQAQMYSFDFFCVLNLAHRLYAMTDNLSKTIQKESFSAIDGQRCADLTLQALKEMRTDEAVKLFYNTIAYSAPQATYLKIFPRCARNGPLTSKTMLLALAY